MTATVTVVTDNARPAIPISTEAVRVGQRIYVIGTPQGLPATFSDGLVSSVRTGEGVSRIQITAPISPGSSGGPVLNAKGQLVGVAVEQFREGQNLNFAIPAADLSGLLKLRTPPKKPAAPPVVRSEKPAAPPSSLERSITSWGKCRILALSDRAGAVAAYDTLAHRLASEFGAEPSPETRAVIERIRRPLAESRHEHLGAIGAHP